MADFPYGHPAWRQARAQTLERDGYECQLRLKGCTGKATQADHIIPVAEGGPPFELANLRAACEHCNTSRGAARVHAMAKLNRQPAPSPSRDW